MRMLSLRLRAALPIVVGALSTASPSSAQTRSPFTMAAVVRGSIADSVAEASVRFGIPERWIDAVIRIESGGDASVTSRVGAMGLMQVMPDTYAMMRTQLGLGANPYDPHDNIIAGAAYLREMHDRYGSAGFLAAYNAGPGRWQDHLAGARPLPAETVRYMGRLGEALDANATLPSIARSEQAALRPEAAPIFVRLSTHGSREAAMTSSSSEQIADMDRRPSRLSSADLDSKALRVEADSSVELSTDRRTIVGHRLNDPNATRLPSLQANSPIFVYRTTHEAQP